MFWSILVLLKKCFLSNPMPKSPPRIWPILYLNYSRINPFISIKNVIAKAKCGINWRFQVIFACNFEANSIRRYECKPFFYLKLLESWSKNLSLAWGLLYYKRRFELALPPPTDWVDLQVIHSVACQSRSLTSFLFPAPIKGAILPP